MLVSSEKSQSLIISYSPTEINIERFVMENAKARRCERSEAIQ